MQRKRKNVAIGAVGAGNISAHAEKTTLADYKTRLYKKHLCACRENESGLMLVLLTEETSLRMQRKLLGKLKTTF